MFYCTACSRDSGTADTPLRMTLCPPPPPILRQFPETDHMRGGIPGRLVVSQARGRCAWALPSIPRCQGIPWTQTIPSGCRLSSTNLGGLGSELHSDEPWGLRLPSKGWTHHQWLKSLNPCRQLWLDRPHNTAPSAWVKPFTYLLLSPPGLCHTSQLTGTLIFPWWCQNILNKGVLVLSVWFPRVPIHP